MRNPFKINFITQRHIKPKNLWPLNVALFLITFFFCVIAGTNWAYKDYYDPQNWQYGLTYAFLIMGFLSAHEFGHYFAARYHGVKSSLPYYIPFPTIPYFIPLSFGTFGAVIKTRSPITSRKALFDIGIAGPLAGFVVCLIYLIYGLSSLPPIDYIYEIHPEYLILYNGAIPETSLHFGDTILYAIMKNVFANPDGFLPPMNEIYHYPFLNVGWFGLFVTTLNLLPLGQLDGGHITYAMFGKHQLTISKIFWWVMLVIGLGSFFALFYEVFSIESDSSIFLFFKGLFYPPLEFIGKYFPIYFHSWGGWAFWAIITRIFIKLKHPVIYDEMPLDTGRKVLGYIAFVILILSFSFNGIYFIE